MPPQPIAMTPSWRIHSATSAGCSWCAISRHTFIHRPLLKGCVHRATHRGPLLGSAQTWADPHAWRAVPDSQLVLGRSRTALSASSTGDPTPAYLRPYKRFPRNRCNPSRADRRSSIALRSGGLSALCARRWVSAVGAGLVIHRPYFCSNNATSSGGMGGGLGDSPPYSTSCSPLGRCEAWRTCMTRTVSSFIMSNKMR